MRFIRFSLTETSTMNIATQMVGRVVAASLITVCMAASALAQSVSFVEPIDGAVDGMEVKPAGAILANSGHHHLLINAEPVKAGEAVPFDATHLHFGKGQTETEVTLPPGQYTLTMQFANGAHQSYGPEMSKTIHVTVK